MRRLDFAVDRVLPNPGRLNHFAVVQLHHQPHFFAKFQGHQKFAKELRQQFRQRSTRIIGNAMAVLAVLAHRRQEHGSIQTFLVAKVVADGRQIDVSRLRHLANRGLLKTVLGEQSQPGSKQPLSRFDAVGARRRACGLVDQFSHGYFWRGMGNRIMR